MGDEADRDDLRAWFNAVKADDVDAVADLLRRGIDIETTDEAGESAVWIANRHSCWKVMDLLDEHGTRIVEEDRRHYEAWIGAIRRDDVPAVLAMLPWRTGVMARRQHKDAVLGEAVWIGSFELVKILMEHGVSLDGEDCFGFTAMTAAVSRSLARIYLKPDPRFLRLLLDAGGVLGLREAVLLDDVELARRRLDEEADPNTGAGSYHGPLLKIAAEDGLVRIVALLLDRGADIEETDDLGQRALHTAAGRGRAEAVACLLDHGADIDALDWFRQSALSNATVGDHREVVDLLMSRGARRGIGDALAMGDVTLFRHVLDQYVRDHDFGQSRGKSCVDEIYISGAGRLAMLAARRGNAACLRLLLDHGAAHFSEGNDARSLLAEAAKHGHAEIVAMLIDRGADPHVVGREGLTPLAWAVKEGRGEVERLLKGKGALS